MQEVKVAHHVDDDAISLVEIVQFVKASYKKILLLALFGLLSAVIITYALGQYTASITLLNSAELDIPRIKYLQATLPKLSQEESVKGSKNYLSSEQVWKSAIKINSLIGKSDAKDLLDPAALKSDRFNVYAIEMIGKANTKQLAKERVQEMSDYFVSGTVYIDLRDLVRQYELNVATTNAKLGTKILNAEVELAYIDRRIKSLNELKKQFPSGVIGQTMLSQVTDAKDSGAKYLPILTQIIAATADQNNQNELLLRYKEEAAQMRIYGSFVEKAKPLIDAGLKDPKLISNLLDIVNQASKEVSTNYEKVALSTIDGDLKKVMGFKLYGLPQVGAVGTIAPAYLKNSAIGLLGGAMIGVLLSLGLVLAQRLRAEMKSAG
jgi:capsular polysaccharide biosynthesis protein